MAARGVPRMALVGVLRWIVNCSETLLRSLSRGTEIRALLVPGGQTQGALSAEVLGVALIGPGTATAASTTASTTTAGRAGGAIPGGIVDGNFQAGLGGQRDLEHHAAVTFPGLAVSNG